MTHGMPGDGETFSVHRETFRKVLGKNFQRPVLIETNAHEGPVYVKSEHALYFTTVPEPGPKNIAIMRLRLEGDKFPFRAGTLETVRQPSNMANGMGLDPEGTPRDLRTRHHGRARRASAAWISRAARSRRLQISGAGSVSTRRTMWW